MDGLACDSMFWYKIFGVCVTTVIANITIIWGNHRYTNGRIDKLNTAIGVDVDGVKDHINECEKGTLEKIAGVKKDFICTLDKAVTKLEGTITTGQGAIFDELKYLRRKQGE